MILLDTQVLLWSSLADARLGKHGRQELNDAQSRAALRMSPISAWEIAMLVSKGRFNLGLPTAEWIAGAVRGHNLGWTELTAEIAVNAGHLPGALHGDPADRLIIATARAHGCPLLTSDRKILAYARAGHVRAIDATR